MPVNQTGKDRPKKTEKVGRTKKKESVPETKKEPVNIELHDGILANSFIRIIISIALAGFGALLLTLAFPPYGIWPLVFVAFVPIFVAVHRVAPHRTAGIVMGLAISGFFWGYFNGIFSASDYLILKYIYIPVFIIFALTGSLQRFFHARTRYRWFVIEGILFWTGMEMVRGFIPSLGTTGFLATALYKLFWFIQPVSVISIYGVTLLIILINCILAHWVFYYIDERWPLNSDIMPLSLAASKRWLFLGAAALIIWTGFSISLLQSPDAVVRVSAIQPGYYIHEAVFGGEQRKVFRKTIEFQEDFEELIDMTKKAAGDNARLIVWSEASLPFNPHFSGTDLLQELVRENAIYLVLGYRDNEEDLEGITIISPDGVFLGRSYQTLIGNIATASSQDVDFTANFRSISAGGTRIIALPTFDDPGAMGPRRLPNAVFRAIENHVSIVKADGHYASAIIDPYGRLLRYTSSESSSRRILTTDIPAGSGNTLVVIWGDWLGWLALGGMLFFILVQLTSLMRTRKQQKTTKK